MYLISSSSMRKARNRLNDVMPYFNKLSYTIADILHHSPKLMHPYFQQRPDVNPEDRKIGYIVVTGDKGLAGSYNHNILKLAEQEIRKTNHPVLYLVGQMGRVWVANKTTEVAPDFLYTAQNPTIATARAMATPLLHQFLTRELDEVWILYTHMINPLHLEPMLVQLLPLSRDIFPYTPRPDDTYPHNVSYYPSEQEVLDQLVPDYLAGMLFGALVESFCSEQSARMTAMDASTKNAKDMLRNLNLTYNRARQSAITQEITEIVGGAQANLD
jgi:F-type H+-transporting ATPase subunit gamma